MRKNHALIVTPEKLLNPIKVITAPKTFLRLHDYISAGINKKRIFKSVGRLHLQVSATKDPIPFSNSLLSITQRTPRSLRPSRKIFSETSQLLKVQNPLPQLSYEKFKTSHLSKKQISMRADIVSRLPEQPEEDPQEIEEVKVHESLRIQIQDYSKEFSSRLSRVHDIVKMVEREHSL